MSVDGAYSSWCHLVPVRTEVNVNTVAVTIREEHHSSTCKLAKLLNSSRTSVNRILTENLAMRRVLSVYGYHIFS